MSIKYNLIASESFQYSMNFNAVRWVVGVGLSCPVWYHWDDWEPYTQASGRRAWPQILGPNQLPAKRRLTDE